MKPKVLPILEECIDRGIIYGYNQAHKHISNPDLNTVADCISKSIMHEIYEYFNFDDD
jgi:predicted Zn-dependent protease with MMP-like domain